jgi:hypothetical protein
VHALELRMLMRDIPTRYRVRPEGSHSKLMTLRHGIRSLRMIAIAVKEERPLTFFCSVGALFAAVAIAIFMPVLFGYLRTGLVGRIRPRFSRPG